MSRNKTTSMVMLLTCVIGTATTAWAVDGVALPTKYLGYSVAVQQNPTAFGNGSNGTLSGAGELSIGSELDALYVTSDTQNLWIGITGNLPNKLADGQTIVVLMQVNDPDFAPDPNLLVTSGLTGDGSGFASVMALNGLTLPAGPTGFYPDYAIAINRSVATPPDSTTYGNAWYLPTNLPLDYDPNITSQNPTNTYASGPFVGQPLYMSVYMNATNTAGVTTQPAPPDGSGPGTQGELAATAVKGLRIRLSLNDAITGVFGIGVNQTIKLGVVLMSPDGTVSNQTLPPLTPALSPTFNNCFPSTQPVSQGAGTFDPVYFKTQDPSYVFFTSVTLNNLGTPGATGKDASNIPTGFPAGSLRAMQMLHTCFGDALPNPQPPIPYTIPGSELDQLFVKRDADPVNGYLNIGVTGNLERNGNKLYLFIDSKAGGQNTLSTTGDPNDGFNWLRTWSGRRFDAGFAPDYAYVINNAGGTFFVDMYNLDPANFLKTYMGSSQVGSGTGLLSGGQAGPPPCTQPNCNGDEFALDNTNTSGVTGPLDAGAPGDATTAVTGVEAKIKLSEIGVDGSTCTIRVAAMLSGGDGSGRSFLSNQALPSYAFPTTQNVGADPVINSTTQPFDFGDDTDNPDGDLFEGKPAFAGDQFASAMVGRQLGDVIDQGNCCINSVDTVAFVQVLLGVDNDASHKFWADMNSDTINDGRDIEPYIAALLAHAPCP